MGNKYTYMNIKINQIYLCLIRMEIIEFGSQNTISLVQELHGSLYAWELGHHYKSLINLKQVQKYDPF